MFERTVELDLPCDAATVFQHVAREFFENHPRWDKDIVELTKVSAGPVGAGTLGREVRDVSGRRFVTDFEVIAFEPDSAFGHRSTAGAMTEDVDYLIRPAGSGSHLSLKVSIRPRNPWLWLATPWIRPQVERNFTANIARFKEMLSSLPRAAEPAPAATG